MIVACLLIMGSFSLLAVNLDNMLGDLEAENEFIAYIDETYTEEQARAIQKNILCQCFRLIKRKPLLLQ